jgi:hypothetical protein
MKIQPSLSVCPPALSSSGSSVNTPAQAAVPSQRSGMHVTPHALEGLDDLMVRSISDKVYLPHFGSNESCGKSVNRILDALGNIQSTPGKSFVANVYADVVGMADNGLPILQDWIHYTLPECFLTPSQGRNIEALLPETEPPTKLALQHGALHIHYPLVGHREQLAQDLEKSRYKTVLIEPIVTKMNRTYTVSFLK